MSLRAGCVSCSSCSSLALAQLSSDIAEYFPSQAGREGYCCRPVSFPFHCYSNLRSANGGSKKRRSGWLHGRSFAQQNGISWFGGGSTSTGHSCLVGQVHPHLETLGASRWQSQFTDTGWQGRAAMLRVAPLDELLLFFPSARTHEGFPTTAKKGRPMVDVGRVPRPPVAAVAARCPLALAVRRVGRQWAVCCTPRVCRSAPALNQTLTPRNRQYPCRPSPTSVTLLFSARPGSFQTGLGAVSRFANT